MTDSSQAHHVQFSSLQHALQPIIPSPPLQTCPHTSSRAHLQGTSPSPSHATPLSQKRNSVSAPNMSTATQQASTAPPTPPPIPPTTNSDTKLAHRQHALNSYLDATTASSVQKLWLSGGDKFKTRDNVQMAADAIADFERVRKGFK